MIHNVVDVQGNVFGLFNRLYLNIYIVVVDRQVAGYGELIAFGQINVASVDVDCVSSNRHLLFLYLLVVHDIVDVQSDFLGLSDRSYFDIHVVVVDRQIASYRELIVCGQGDVAGVNGSSVNSHSHSPLFDLFAIYNVVNVQGDFFSGGFLIQSHVQGGAIYTDIQDYIILQPFLPRVENISINSSESIKEFLRFLNCIHSSGQAVGDGMPNLGNQRSGKVAVATRQQDILIAIFRMQNIALVEVGDFLCQVLTNGNINLLDRVLNLLILSGKDSAIPLHGDIIDGAIINFVVLVVFPASQFITVLNNQLREQNIAGPIIRNNRLIIFLAFCQLTMLASIKRHIDQGVKCSCQGILVTLIKVRNVERIFGRLFRTADVDVIPSSKTILGRIVGHSFNIDKALLSVAVKSLHLSHFAAGNFDLAVCQLRSIFNLSFITGAVAVCHSDLAIFRSLGKDHIFILNELGSQSIAFASGNTFQRIDTIITRYISTLASPAGKEILEVAAIFALYLGNVQDNSTVGSDGCGFGQSATDNLTLVRIHHIVNCNGISGFFFPLGSIGCVLSDSVGHFGVPTIKDVTLTGGIGTIIIGRSICTPQQILMDLVFKDLFALHAVIVGNRVLGFLIIGLTILVFVLCPDGVQGGVLCHCYFCKQLRTICFLGNRVFLCLAEAQKNGLVSGEAGAIIHSDRFVLRIKGCLRKFSSAAVCIVGQSKLRDGSRVI